MTESVLAAATFTGQRANGQRLAITMRVHAPIQFAPGEWHCSVELDGLHDHLHPVAGEDAIQSLCLGLGLAASLLRAFVADGGRLFFVDTHSEVPLDAYFGPFVQAGQSGERQ